MLKRVWTVMLLALLCVSLTACNTVKGFGKDIEAAGGAIQDASN